MRLFSAAFPIWPSALVCVCVVAVPTDIVEAASFVVDTTLDAVDAVPGDGVCASGGGVCTLRAAVEEANALGGAGHVITLPPGTFSLSLTGASAGELQLRITETITINGASAETTIVRGGASSVFERVFLVTDTTGRLTLTDLTVENGRESDGISGSGGCIRTGFNTELILMRVIVRDCEAELSGGGILVEFGSFFAMTDTTVTDNKTVSSSGAGVFINTGVTATIVRSTISNNSSGFRGGGIDSSGLLTLANTTISGNSAFIGGSAMRQSGGSIVMENVTVNGNTLTSTLGTSQIDVSAALTVSVTNTIISNPGAAGVNCNAPVVTSVHHNVEFPGTSCGFLDPTDQQADPLLGPLASNGGPTQTHALSSGSPAIDLGDDAVCVAALVDGVDQRGFGRPSGAHCDAGAYELFPTPTVSSIVPVSGPTTGGTGVTITGTNFVSGATATLGGVAATSVTVVGATTITATTGAHAAGTVDVVVTNPDAQSGTLASGFTYTPLEFTDDPLVPGTTEIKAVHITELRTRINALRVGCGLSDFAFTDATLTAGSTTTQAVHVTELRTALSQAYVGCGQSAPTFTDATLTAGSTVIKAVHIAELRAAVIALE